MGYELHIRRLSPASPISLTEWETAVSKLENARRSPTEPGAVEHQLDGLDWIPTIYFSRDAATLNARGLMGDETGHVWASIDALCRALDATLTGDEGEIFDLDAGNPFL